MRSSLCLLFALVVTVSGCFDLDRADALAGGVITGLTVDNDGNVAAGAVVSVVDAGVTVVADRAGRFRVAGLAAGPHVVRLVIDADGNGAPELGKQVNASISPLGAGAGGIDIGVVRLLPTGKVKGKVVDVDGAGVANASVALWRNVELDGDSLDLAADLLVTTADDGGFAIDGVVVGDARLAAFEAIAGETTRASTPLALNVVDSGETDAGTVVLNVVAGTRPARLRFSTAVSGAVELRLARAGGVRPAEPTVTTDVSDVESVAFLVPFGVWDVYVNVGASTAQLRSQVAPFTDDNNEVSWGVVALLSGVPAPAQACGDGVVDVDEACDDGAANGDFPDACRSDCSIATCGDGVVDSDEGCDDGSANALGCVPDDASCSWCDAITCSVGIAVPRAEVTVDVRSVQGWGIEPVVGVPVVVEGVERLTTADGTAVFVVDLPTRAPIRVGGADAAVPSRAWVAREVAMPALRHNDRTTVATSVFEGCRMFVDETTTSDPSFDESVFGEGLVLDVASHPGCDTLQQLRFEVGGQLVDAAGAPTTTFSLRVAAATDVFTDPEAFAAFPPTVAADGTPLMCDALFDLEFDDDVRIDATVDAPKLRPFAGGSHAWLYDEAQGAFVEQPDAFDVELGYGLTGAGLWCLGEPSTTNDCLIVDVVSDTGNAVADARVDVAIADELGTTLRRTTTGADGASDCIDVSRASIAVAVEGPDGARGVVSGVEFFTEGTVSCAVDACTHVTVTLPTTPYDGCLVVRPTLDLGKGALVTSGTLVLREQGPNGEQHRGSFPWRNIVERCVAVPNRAFRLTATFEEDGESFCTFGLSSEVIDASEQSPSTEPPVCGSEDCTTVDLDFFCGGS